MTYNLKSAKIGGTINFGSAGSFSFSFGAEIGSPEDYLRLVEQGASSLLGQFRDADEETKSAVRAYIARLCSIPEDRVPVVQPAQKSAPVEEPEPAPVRAPEPTPPAPPNGSPACCRAPATSASSWSGPPSRSRGSMRRTSSGRGRGWPSNRRRGPSRRATRRSAMRWLPSGRCADATSTPTARTGR